VCCFYLYVPVLCVSYFTAFTSRRRKTRTKYYVLLRAIILVLSCSNVKSTATLAHCYVPSEHCRQTASRIKMFILCFIDQSLDGLRRGNGMVEMAVHREADIKS
jgi:hypothetical protein